MQVVILAGGRGTRLAEHARTIPKPMVTIGGRPNLEHQILLAARHGFTSALLLVSHLADPIMAHFGDGQRFGLEVAYCVEDPPLGTAGALRHAAGQLQDRFLLLLGDVFIDCDLARLWNDHERSGALATLAVHTNDHPYDCDLVEADAARWISAIHPKSRPVDQFLANVVNAGAIVIERELLLAIPPDRHLDLASEVLPALAAGGRLRAYRTTEYFRDFGAPDRLARTRLDFDTGMPVRCRRTSRRPAVLLNRGGLINKGGEHLSHLAEMELIAGSAAAIRRLNEAGFLVIIVADQPSVARDACMPDTLRLFHNKMETLLGREHAWIDALYVCPHHSDAGFAGELAEPNVECACNKPKRAIFEQAVRDWNVSLPGSYGVGDSPCDAIAARRIGIGAIGLRTGCGCPDCNAFEAPERLAADLGEAVNIILAQQGAAQIEAAYP